MRRLARTGMAGAQFAGIASAGLVFLLAAMAQAEGIATHTTLTAETRQIAGHTVPAYAATVLSEDGTPAAGIVTLVEKGRPLASAALDREGNAAILFDGLAAGDHSLRAVYSGDAAHAGSRSDSLPAHSDAVSGTPDFSLTISPTTLPALAPGASGNVTATIASLNGFTGFLSLSCAGAPITSGSSTDTAMPVGVSCTFTPANLEMTSTIAASSTPTVASFLTVQTTAPSGPGALNRVPASPRGPQGGAPLALAILLPGIFGLGFLGRRRKHFGRAALLLLVAGFSVLVATGCNPRYYYLKHPPTYNPGTTPGSYTLTVWAQTSNGVTASEHFTTLGLTVN